LISVSVFPLEVPLKPTRLKSPSSLHDLVFDDQNANRGTDRGRTLLAASFAEHGAGRSILVDRHGRIIAGNKTAEEAKARGLPIQVVTTDGTTLVVVQRRDLDLKRDPSARALAIRDNRVAELDLNWDPQVLEALRREGVSLESLWSPEEWRTLLGDEPMAAAADDHVFEPGPTTLQRGDLLRLGRHRLLCGDATNGDDVARLLGDAVPLLMCTDPPYGVQYAPTWRQQVNPRQRTAAGTVMHDDQAAWPAAFRSFPGDVVYAWHAGARSIEAGAALEQAGFQIRAQIIWRKPHIVLSRGHYHHQHEPCFYAVRRGKTGRWTGDRTQSTVWDVPNLNPFGRGDANPADARTPHSTQKPVRLFEIPMLNHTSPGEAVYDPFAGSGSSVIAAEKLGRAAYVMDLDPRYVQLIADRWERYTGQRAERVASRGRGRR